VKNINLRSPIWLDIETGGIDPSKSSILSIASGQGTDIRSTFSAPQAGTFLSAFSEEKIIPQLRGKSLLSEKQNIESLIQQLETNPRTPIAGFNIRGFDIGFIQRRARTYGLEKRFLQTMRNREVLDPANSVKDIVASAISRHADIGTFNQSLGAASWQEAESVFGELPFSKRPVEYNLLAQVKGYLTANRETAMFKGWKLEDLYKLLPGEGIKGQAHEAATDIKMTQRVMQAARSGELEKELQNPTKALQWMETVKARGFGKFQTERLLAQADIDQLGLKVPRWWQTKQAKIAGLGLAAVVAASLFSGKDDEYNTIEGLPHGGFAQSGRLQLTEFGSGYRGIIKISKLLTQNNPFATNSSVANAGDIRYAAKYIRNLEQGFKKSGMSHEVAQAFTDVKTEIRTAIEAGHKDIISVFEENLHNTADRLGVSPVSYLKEIIRHENVHVGIRVNKPSLGRGIFELDQQENLITDFEELKTFAKEHGIKPSSLYTWSSRLLQHNYNNKNVDLYLEERLAWGIQHATRTGSRGRLAATGIPAEGLYSATKEQFIQSYSPNSPLSSSESEFLDALYQPLSTKEMQVGLEFERQGRVSRLAKAKYFKEWIDVKTPVTQNAFSGFDDNFNTIEGLNHTGIAGVRRKKITDFGSGFTTAKGVAEHLTKTATTGLKEVVNSAVVKETLQLESEGIARQLLDGREAANIIEGLDHSGIASILRKNTDFSSPAVGARTLRRAERLYKSTMRASLQEAGYKGKIDWLSHIDEDTGDIVLAARNAKGERLMGIQRSLQEGTVSLTSIEIDPSLRGGLGRRFYELEGRMLKRLGFEGAEITSPVANPVTGRMQAQMYGSKPMSIFNRDLEEAYGVNPTEFHEMLMSKKMTKEQWEAVGLAPTFVGRIPTRNSANNTIDGMGHSGIAHKLRKLLSPFGSKWDGLRNFIQGTETFQEMISSKGFQKALKDAVTVRQLGIPGAFGSVHEMRATFRGREFSFARKTGSIQELETDTMNMFSESFAPSVYSHSKSHIDMEMFQGKEFADVANLDANNITELVSNVKEMHRKGIVHGDLHQGNIMLTKEGNVGIIDWGTAGPTGSIPDIRLNGKEVTVNNVVQRNEAIDWNRVFRISKRSGNSLESYHAAPLESSEIRSKTVVGRKKKRQSELQKAASATAWMHGKNGGRKSRL
jgi:hypothetical protein